MARQQPVNPLTTYSGSSDTTRYPGFRGGGGSIGDIPTEQPQTADAASVPAYPTVPLDQANPTIGTPQSMLGNVTSAYPNRRLALSTSSRPALSSVRRGFFGLW